MQNSKWFWELNLCLLVLYVKGFLKSNIKRIVEKHIRKQEKPQVKGDFQHYYILQICRQKNMVIRFLKFYQIIKSHPLTTYTELSKKKKLFLDISFYTS